MFDSCQNVALSTLHNVFLHTPIQIQVFVLNKLELQLSIYCAGVNVIEMDWTEIWIGASNEDKLAKRKVNLVASRILQRI